MGDIKYQTEIPSTKGTIPREAWLVKKTIYASRFKKTKEEIILNLEIQSHLNQYPSLKFKKLEEPKDRNPDQSYTYKIHFELAPIPPADPK